MKRKAPPVRQYMTRLPVEAENCETAGQAMRLMETHHVRHIPVMNGSHLVGVLSETDIDKAKINRGEDITQHSLQAVCQQDVLTVSPLTPVNEVASQMFEKAVDNAVVLDGGFVVGIFTVTDALRCLRDWEQL